MSRKTRVCIQRVLFLSKIIGSIVGFICLLVRFPFFRNMVCMFLIACVITAVWEYAEWSARNDVEFDKADIV